jgi:tetratricopeptide (TPR) repeat protein
VALSARGVALAACLVLVAGCAAGPSGKPARATKAAAPRRPGVISEAKAEGPRVPPSTDWESFTATGKALKQEIATRAAALKSGPVGNRAVELASLRLAASGRELIDAGSLDGAVEVLQKAISMWGSNGYAYLELGYVHHVQGHDDRAAEFAASAARYLPREHAVRAELEGLRRSIAPSPGA